MIKLIFYGILIYLLYKLIFGFIIPVSRATRHVKSRIREAQAAQERFQQQQQRYNPVNDEPKKTKPNGAPGDADYIDFEEVK